MASAEIIVDRILSDTSGRIVAANLLDGLRLGHLDEAFLVPILRWWGEFVTQTSKSEGEIGASIGFLSLLFRGLIPGGFEPPLSALPNPHIHCRRAGGLEGADPGGSVRSAAVIKYWTVAQDINDLEDDGIDLTSRPGQVAYEALVTAPRSVLARKMRVERGKTLTNPRDGADGVLFFTDGASLLTLLDDKDFSEKADTARDHLGLIHLRKGDQVAAVLFPPHLAEGRPDRGRPTAIDARGNSRFLCDPSDTHWEPGWGRTAELARAAGGAAGLPERICGPFPSNTTDEVEVEVLLLGSIRVPRGDVEGVGDAEYADFLERRTVGHLGLPLKDVLISYLS
jgi:hypothetical protein